MKTLRRFLVLWMWSVILIGLATPAWAQRPPPGPSLYRLERGSAFNRGCYAPCECPLQTADHIRGTFKLTLDHADPLFTYYRVDDANWNVTLGDQEFRVIGSGTYKRGGEVAQQHQMTLTLTIDGEHPQPFDSGLVDGGGDFPAIVISISVNGMVCYDTVIDIAAKVVPADEIVPYKLKSSTYDEGCFAPCDCPLHEYPITGAFNLVELPNATTPVRREWAVVDINWHTISLAPPGRTFTGFGNYAIINVGPTNQQHMQLDILDSTTGTAVPTRFDSGQVAGGSQFPNIDVNLAVNGFYCNDRAFFLHCTPQ